MEAELASLRDALRTAADDPNATSSAIGAILRRSLCSDWRSERAIPEFLKTVADLCVVHLDVLSVQVPLVVAVEVDDEGKEPEPSLEASREAACTVCLKLARNLCANQPSAQEYWWVPGGVAERLIARVRADLAEPGLRGAAWREVAVGFLANSVAGNATVREVAREALFPHGLAAACAMVRHRPELAFVLTQNLFAEEKSASGQTGKACRAMSPLVRRLVDTADGHCVLYLLLSLLRNSSDGDGATGDGGKDPDQAVREWAAIFFHGLWMQGTFPLAYQGVKSIMVVRLYYFFSCAAGVDEAANAQGRPLTSLQRLAGGLCGHEEALGLLWHTVHGLLAGPGSEVECDDGKLDASACLVRVLLEDSDFARVAAEEMAEALAALSAEFGLAWRPAAASPEAIVALGVSVEDTDIKQLASAATERRREVALDRPGPLDADLGTSAAVSAPPAGAAVIRDILAAALELSAVAGSAGTEMPGPLVAVYLLGNVALVDALHRLRFGAEPEAKTLPQDPAVLEACRACRIVDHLRLCANILYDCQGARTFLRLTGGLRVLLSNCYADPELPLLREAGVYAVRAATRHDIASQEAVRALLSERSGVSGASGAVLPGAAELAL